MLLSSKKYYNSRRTGEKRDFSVQQLVDCNTSNFAFDGGTLTRVIKWHVTSPTIDGTNYQYINGKKTYRFASYISVFAVPHRLLRTTKILNKLHK